MISPAREIAFKVLESVHGGAYASDSLRHCSEKPSARDAALAEAIVFGCLRYQAQLDFLISHYSGRIQKLDTAVRIALRMGIFQIRYLNKIPAHAAVQESVELVKRAHKRSAAGFVNAVLRKVDRGAVRWPDRATELSMPPWLLARWDAQYGAETGDCIARAALQEPVSDLNTETGRQQDVGAQSIVPHLKIAPGMMALDLCAAPGNKTAQMLAAGAKVIACDRSFQRLSTVPEEAMRVVADATRELPFRTKFDRILVDAPCSGTGTLARNPEIKWRVNDDDIRRFPQTQRAILENALSLLKPGGRLVYSTCSLEHEENEGVIEGLGFREHTMRIPGREAGDGFFIGIKEGSQEV